MYWTANTNEFSGIYIAVECHEMKCHDNRVSTYVQRETGSMKKERNEIS